MPRITNLNITDRFIEAFEGDQPFTPSEKRMLGIKLSHLKKNIKQHLASTGRITDLSVEQIILDAIEYSVMTNMKFRSIASLGYNVLDPSIDYWEKRRKLESLNDDAPQINHSIQTDDFYTQNDEKSVDEVVKESYNKDKPKRTPSWMNNTGW